MTGGKFEHTINFEMGWSNGLEVTERNFRGLSM